MSTLLRPDAGSPRRRAREPGRDEAILDAAMSLFVAKGFDATSTDEIAARAGVAKGTLYLYHASKLEMLGAVADRLWSRAAASSPQPAPGAGRSGADALREALVAVAERLAQGDAGRLLRIAIAEAHNLPSLPRTWIERVVEPCCASIARIVQQGIEQGEFRCADPRAAAASLVLPIFMAGLQQQLLRAVGESEERLGGAPFIDHHLDLVLQGLRRG
ncbi:TetR/AcrR family transcriptional regulator [Caldimonas sp. KR1-144]|uniref:TetR/AcrR family transcriptional regulator n=1 Tax=Caldimonas sp. KR1-144 TaxID=3400911 RepID=UPI003C0B0FE7